MQHTCLAPGQDIQKGRLPSTADANKGGQDARLEDACDALQDLQLLCPPAPGQPRTARPGMAGRIRVCPQIYQMTLQRHCKL